MTVLSKLFLIVSAVYAFLSIAGGAFGAHYLKSKLSVESLNILEVAIRYQMFHALALMCLALFLTSSLSAWWAAAGWLFIIGTFLFSGSLYALVLSGIKIWGAVTPIGGLLLLVGWLFVLIGTFFF